MEFAVAHKSELNILTKDFFMDCYKRAKKLSIKAKPKEHFDICTLLNIAPLPEGSVPAIDIFKSINRELETTIVILVETLNELGMSIMSSVLKASQPVEQVRSELQLTSDFTQKAINHLEKVLRERKYHNFVIYMNQGVAFSISYCYNE